MSQLDALAENIIKALPEHARIRVIDAMDGLGEAEGYVRARIGASIDPSTARRGEIEVMTRSGDAWHRTRFKDHAAFTDSLSASQELREPVLT